MGVFKKFRGGYAHEAVQADYDTNTGAHSYKPTVPNYKDKDGTTHNTIQLCDNVTTTAALPYLRTMLTWALPYKNLTPVPMSVGLYESALGLSYDSTKTYYTSNTGATVASMSGYTQGDTITDDVYYCTYDVEDYDIATGAVGGTQTVARSKSVADLSATNAVTVTIVNDTAADIVVKSVKFWNTVAYDRPSSVATCDVLKCAFYLSPSEYVTIPAGETGAVVVVLDFGKTN